MHLLGQLLCLTAIATSSHRLGTSCVGPLNGRRGCTAFLWQCDPAMAAIWVVAGAVCTQFDQSKSDYLRELR